MLHHAFDEMGGISKEEWIASYDKVTAAEGKEWRARGQRVRRDMGARVRRDRGARVRRDRGARVRRLH